MRSWNSEVVYSTIGLMKIAEKWQSTLGKEEHTRNYNSALFFLKKFLDSFERRPHLKCTLEKVCVVFVCTQ